MRYDHQHPRNVITTLQHYLPIPDTNDYRPPALEAIWPPARGLTCWPDRGAAPYALAVDLHQRLSAIDRGELRHVATRTAP